MPIIIDTPSPPTTFTEQIAASSAAWGDPDGNWQALNAAKAHMVEQVFAIVADQGSPDDPDSFIAGWAVLLDPDQCPAQFIPYGAQFVGVQIPPNTPEDEARAIWKAEGGFARGTGFGGTYNSSTTNLAPPDNGGAIVVAAQRFLTGTQTVTLLERQGPGGPDPYRFMLIIRPEELVDLNGLTNAVNAVKPAGLQWTPLVETDGTIWAAETHTWASGTQTWQQKG